MSNCNLKLQVFVNSLHKYVTYNETLIDENEEYFLICEEIE